MGVCSSSLRACCSLGEALWLCCMVEVSCGITLKVISINRYLHECRIFRQWQNILVSETFWFPLESVVLTNNVRAAGVGWSTLTKIQTWNPSMIVWRRFGFLYIFKFYLHSYACLCWIAHLSATWLRWSWPGYLLATPDIGHCPQRGC